MHNGGMDMLGVIANVAAVLAGSTIGLICKR